MIHGLGAALRHLTVLPVPLGGAGQLVPGRALPWFPVVGVAVGGAVSAVLLLPVPPVPRAALALTVWVAITGALHEDGLMDSADAAFAPVRRGEEARARRLGILKDPRVGAHGATVGTVVLLLRFGALTAVPAAAPMVAASLGRWLMTLSLAGWPAARADGLGARFAQGAGVVGPGVVAVVVLFLLSRATDVLATALATAGALTVGLTAAAWLARRFGGLTGDAHGAVGLVAETTALYVFLGVCGWA